MTEEYAERNKCANYFRIVVLGLGGFYFGYYVACMNALTKPILVGVLNYDSESSTFTTLSGMVNFVFAVGAFTGVMISGNLADKLGRRFWLYGGEILALFVIGIYMIGHIAALLVARYFSGMVAGINISIFTVMLGEGLPNRLCGLGNGLGYIALTIGIVLSYLNQNIWDYSSITNYWRLFFIYPIAVSIFRLICFPFLFKKDSPKYIFLSKSSSEAARQEIRESLKPVYADSALDAVTDSTLHSLERESTKGKANVLTMFSKRYIRQLMSSFFVAFIQQWCGINFLIFYSTSLFDKLAGIGKEMALFIGLGNLVGGIISTILITRSGRKPNLVYGCACDAVAWFLLLIAFKTSQVWLLIIASLFYIITYAIGLGGTITAYVGEVLPPAGVGLAFGFQWVNIAITGLTFPFLTAAVGETAMIIGFGVISALGAVGLFLWTIETKNKSLEQVEEEFTKGKSASTSTVGPAKNGEVNINGKNGVNHLETKKEGELENSVLMTGRQ